MRNLYLLRHAKTNQISPTGKDFDRELLPKGKKQVLQLSTYFGKFPFQNKTKGLISTAKRTQQTYLGIKNELNFAETTHLNELYLCSHHELLQIIWNQETEKDLFIIGHNNGISDLASYFLEVSVDLATSEFVHLQFDCDSWQETSKGLATLANRFHPKVD